MLPWLLRPEVFPYILTFLDLCACIAYLAADDIRRAIYWLAAAVLTMCVTL